MIKAQVNRELINAQSYKWKGGDPMLVFTYSEEVDHEVKRRLKEQLQKETGQKCIILDME